jgi:electron transfer flavoprotein alpha subunit
VTDEPRDVLVVAEHRRGELRPVSYELVGAGRDLTDSTGGDLRVAVVGGDVETFADQLDREGVDVVHTVDEGEEFNHDVYAAVTTALVESFAPGVVVMPHSANGLDYAPAVATRLSVPLVTDAVDLAVDDGLTITREAYGSAVEATLSVDERPVVLTLRPGAWPPVDDPGTAELEPVDLPVDEASIRTTVRGFEETAVDEALVEADVVVAVGRGVDDEATFERIERLADALDAALAASSPVVDRGWLPVSRRVGRAGASVSPEVYLALGISGAPQHLAGLVGAETVVAVNTDPNAPIFGVADYGVVDDVAAVVPELADRFGV